MAKLIFLSFVLALSLGLVRSERDCLMRDFIAVNQTSDGLKDCECPSHLEYDPFFGVCFENKCKQECGDMNCAIRKPVKDRFEYLCFCEEGYKSLNADFKLACVPFESLPGHQMVSKNLPKNPLLMKKLGCSQAYKVVGDKYECSCLDGYEMGETGECRLTKKCLRRCPPNAVCTVDNQNNTHCTCKTGFFGPDCEDHFCMSDFKNATSNEQLYLQLATMNVCGSKKCSLNDKNEFECECPSFRMEKGNDGFCHIRKPCSKNMIGYETCKENDQLCSVRIDEQDNYRCNCETSVGYKNSKKCNDYRPKLRMPSDEDYVLRMNVRMDWEAEGKYELFNHLFSNQIRNLLSPDLKFKLPEFALPEFVEYEQEVFESYEQVPFFRKIQDEKLQIVFMKGIKGFDYLDEKCVNHTVYPRLVAFDIEKFKPTRLVDTVFSVSYLLKCDKPIDKNDLLEKFKNEFLQSGVVKNHLYMKHVGFVKPDSIRI